jgi:hypothetical protein
MIIHNPILTGSFTVNGTDVSSITSSAASLTSLNAYTASQNNRNGTYATTGSNTFAGVQTVNSNLVVTGSITAQTLVVQTVTSSVVYSSGSNVFGNNIANTQVMTGSVTITGSLAVVTNGTEFQVTNTGVRLGNALTDSHVVTGSVGISGSATFVGNVIIRPSSGYNALFQINSTALRINYLNDAQDTNISAAYRAADFVWQNNTGATTFNIASTGAAAFSGSLTMNAYSYAASAIQFTRANTNTVSPASGNGILVFAGGNAQMRMDTSNGICFDMNNGGTPYTALKIQQNGNTVLVNSPDNTLSLGLGYQGTIHGYLGGFSSRLEAYSNNGGYVYLSSGSTWIAASDIKRKRNFETYSLGLDAILGLQPKLYNMDFQQDEDEKQVGLVAQEVKDFIPLAYEENNNFIGLNYNTIIVTLINAVKELKAQINELKNN